MNINEGEKEAQEIPNKRETKKTDPKHNRKTNVHGGGHQNAR